MKSCRLVPALSVARYQIHYIKEQENHDVVLFCIFLFLLCLFDRAGNLSANGRHMIKEIHKVVFPAFGLFREWEILFS